jgi:hypothetical protein
MAAFLGSTVPFTKLQSGHSERVSREGSVILAWQASVITVTAVIAKYDMTYRRCPPQDCLKVVIQVSLVNPGGQILPNAQTESISTRIMRLKH